MKAQIPSSASNAGLSGSQRQAELASRFAFMVSDCGAAIGGQAEAPYASGGQSGPSRGGQKRTELPRPEQEIRRAEAGDGGTAAGTRTTTDCGGRRCVGKERRLFSDANTFTSSRHLD